MAADLAVRTVGLRKVLRAQRGRRVAVAGLDLAIPRGGVHALLGAPGSGRSEVLRLLVGLSSPSAGSIEVLGVEVPRRLAEVVGRVGAMVEEPTFSPALSGRRNLRLLARAAGVEPAGVDAVVERFGLSETMRHRYAGYSVDERQRLALVAALLKDPELLVLDEPTADLDAAGAREVLALLRERGTDHGGRARTVLLTTDDPAVALAVCDTVSVVEQGRLLTAGPVAEVLGDARPRTRVRVAEPERAEQLLAGAGYVVTRDGGRDLIVSGHDQPQELSRLLAGHDVFIEELAAVRPDLAGLLAGMQEAS